MLSAIETAKKTGKEPFRLDGESLPFDVLSFWQWSSSELLGNALRGVLAEFIIASALGITEKPREEWDFYVLNTKVLNKQVKKQKTITLSRLLQLNPIRVKYDGIKREIDSNNRCQNIERTLRPAPAPQLGH